MSIRDELKEQVANAISEALINTAPRVYYPDDPFRPFKKQPEPYRKFNLDIAEAILSLEVSGHRLLIGKVGAELPKDPYSIDEYPDGSPLKEAKREGFKRGQQSMLKEGWVKEVKG